MEAVMSRRLVGCVLVLTIVFMALGAAVSAQVRVVAPRQGSQDDVATLGAAYLEHGQRQAALASIAQDRASFVASIIDRWSADLAARDFSDRARTGLRRVLTEADAERLYQASMAPSYGELLGILSGRGLTGSATVLPTGEPGPPNALGSAGLDLVYTPVTPCRALDTRYATGTYTGPWAPNSTKSIMVTDTIQAGQGGLLTCGIPSVVTKAVVLNITAVGPYTYGDLRIYPYLSAIPNASILNFGPYQNIANAVVAPICLGCGLDLSILNDAATTDVIVDVLGYFAAPIATPLSVTVKTATFTVAAPIATDFDLTSPVCDVGTTLTGGGFDQQGGSSAANLWFWASEPNAARTAWRIRGRNNSSATVDVFVYAFCAKVPGR
jgi:hypothetical protein